MGPTRDANHFGEPALQNSRDNLSAGVIAAGFGTAMLLGLALAGCAQPLNEPTGSQARDTGTYPNLNIKPGVAAQQLTPEQTAAAQAQLRASQQANASGPAAGPNDEAALRKLAAGHGKEALDVIEDQ